jgi:membrane-associated protease RseP (regulator of RpoE activity)
VGPGSDGGEIMALNRKGFFFTLAAVMFIFIIMLYISSQQQTRLRLKAPVIEQRMMSLDHFMSDIERDIERGGYIASFRALLAIQQHIISEGDYMDDTDAIMKGLILNGTIDGSYVSVMNSTELSVWTERIRFEAGKIGINVDCVIVDVELRHLNPWTLVLSMDTVINITDRSGLAFWNSQKEINSTLSIVGFEDPVYSVSTLGRVINTIETSPHERFVIGTEASNLKDHALNSRYIASNNSPSYLMRIEGNMTSSEFGIESLVNLLRLEMNEITVLNKTCVDHIYFSAANPTSYYINGTYNWLRIDNTSGRLGLYDADGIALS